MKNLTLKEFNSEKYDFMRLYEEVGIGAIYRKADIMELPYSYCKECDADTPTLSTGKHHECAVCANNK